MAMVVSPRMDDLRSRLQTGHFLVTRTDRLGDMILTGPLFDAIKQAFPRSRLSVLASAANASIARMHAAVDEVIVDAVEARDSRWQGTLALARKLRRMRPDAVVFANDKHRLAVAAFLARVPLRVGGARRRYAVLYNRRLPDQGGPEAEHETDRTLRLLSMLGVPAAALHDGSGALQVQDADRLAVDALLARHRLPAGKGIAVVHATNSGNALNASPGWYGALVDALAEAGYEVLLTGTLADREQTALVAAATGCSPIDLAGELSVGELAALLARSALCIGSSTGPTHLAAALGAPTVGLYAPLRRQATWLPRGAAVAVLRPDIDMYCQSCLGPRCRYFNCLEHISPRDVVAAGHALARKSGLNSHQS